MPSWKKVITSGSDAAFRSVTATTGFTGSLSGSVTSATNATNAFNLTTSPQSPPGGAPGGVYYPTLVASNAGGVKTFYTFTAFAYSSSINLLLATSSWARSASQALTASYITGSIFTSTNPVLSASFAQTASYVNGSVFTNTNPALSASYALTANAIASPLSQDLTINGTFIVNNNTHDVFNTTETLLYDSTDGLSSFDWGSRQLLYPDGSTVAIDYSNTDDNLLIQNFNSNGGITISSSRPLTLDSIQGVNIYNPYLFVPTGGLTSDTGNYLLTTTLNNSVGSVPFQSFSKIIGKTTSSITISGTGNQISISSSLTSGLIETGSIIRITTRIIKTSAAGATTASIYYESPQSSPNSILLGQYIIPTGNVYTQMQRDLIVQNNGATAMFNASSSALTDVTSSNAGFTTRNLNWGIYGDGGTRNISVYLSNLNSGDSSYAASLLIEKL